MNNFIDSIKKFFGKNLGGKLAADIFLYTVLFLITVLSIMGIIMAISSNKYNSVVLKQDDSVKGMYSDTNENDNTGFMIGSSSNENDDSINPDYNQEANFSETNSEFISISCSKAYKDYIDNVESVLVNEVKAKFIKNSEYLYSADVLFAIISNETDYKDLDSLQASYRRELSSYAELFDKTNYNIVFYEPDRAYINMENLNSEEFLKGYNKVIPTYYSFVYTFKLGGYKCE